jgi:hypothetical protein
MKVQKLTVSIGQLSQKWTSPIYVFFKPTPRIEYKDGRACHIFECDANRCKGKNGRDVRVFLIKVIQTPPETFVSMQKYAGEMKLLKPQMQQRTWMLQGKY